MFDLELGALGAVQAQKPDSLAVCFEFTSIWAGETDSSVIARLCAGAIGIYTDKAKILPKYRPFSQRPLEYGYKCLERLLARGVVPNVIFEGGSKCLTDMAMQIPTNEEVKEQINFSRLGGGDT